MADQELLKQFSEMFPQLGTEVIAQILLMTRNDPQKTLAVAMQVLDQAQQEESEEEENYDNVKDSRSIVIPVREYESKCGYCKNKEKKTSVSYGMTAERLKVEDYQSLIDRGWRRSGTWLYKPTLNKTCCPQYTIRLDVHQFNPSKTHKKILNKVAKYLLTGKVPKKIIPDETEMDTSDHTKTDQISTNNSNQKVSPTSKKEPSLPRQLQPSATPDDHQKMDLIAKAVTKAILEAVEGGLIPWPNVNTPTIEALVHISIPATPKQRQQCTYFTNVAVDIFQHIKDHTKQLNPPKIAAILAKKISEMEPSVEVKAAGTFLNFGNGDNTQPSPQKRLTQDITDQVPKKPKKNPVQPDNIQGNNSNNQNEMMMKKKSSSDKLDSILSSHGLHKMELSLRRSEFDDEEFQLYCKYQKIIHGDKDEKLTRDAYTKFLVKSPLIFEPSSPSNPSPECGYGSFHQQYRIDGKLMGVGVIDILPLCVSSVYFFYDPDYQFLTPGVFSALQEIHLTEKFSTVAPNLHYYYLGFYIHSCRKMRYKGQYKPSDLLCPETFQWVPISDSVPILNVTKYSKLAKDAPSETYNPKDVYKIPLLFKDKIYQVTDFTLTGQKQLIPQIETYLKVVGSRMADKMLFVIK